MVNILSVLSLLLAFTASAAVVPSGVPSFTIGSTATSPLGLAQIPPSALSDTTTPLFSIYAGPGTANTAGNVMPFLKNGVVYQVTSGKTAYCGAITGWTAAAIGSVWGIMYADASFADNATVASLTTPVFQSGVSTSYPMIQSVAAYIKEQHPGVFAFPAQKYPGIQIGASNAFGVSMLCYEK